MSKKVSCRALTGKYKGYHNKWEEVIYLFMKNGSLYCSAGGPTKINQYIPGHYFTADGEPIVKRNGILYLRNRAYYKY